jgi:hypothetical protein
MEVHEPARVSPREPPEPGYEIITHKRRGNQGKLSQLKREKCLYGVFQRTAAVFRVCRSFVSSCTRLLLRLSCASSAS